MTPLLAAALLLASLGSAMGQTLERLPKVGFLSFGAISQQPTQFKNRLSELGYREGKEVVVEYRFADGRAGELPRLARELVDAKVDVIIAAGDEAIVAAARDAVGPDDLLMVYRAPCENLRRRAEATRNLVRSALRDPFDL